MEEKRRNEFKLELVPEENIIIVSCEGFQQEYFVPKIQNGQIILTNIIPNKRCCLNNGQSKVTTTTAIKSILKEPSRINDAKAMSTHGSSLGFTSTNNDSSGMNTKKITPMAKSTPLFQRQSNNNNSNTTPVRRRDKPRITQVTILPPLQNFNFQQKLTKPKPQNKALWKDLIDRNKENIPPDSNILTQNSYKASQNSTQPTYSKHVPIARSTPLASSSSDASLPTPEIVRRAPVKTDSIRIIKLPPSITIRKQQVSFENKPKTPKKQANNTLTSSQSLNRSLLREHVSNLVSSSPILQNKALNISSPHLPKTPDLNARKLVRRSILGTSCKWHKLKTPIRTYSRKNPLVSSSMKKRRKTPTSEMKTVKPFWKNNPTQGLPGDYTLEFRRRKILFDVKNCISPKTFKKQLTATDPKSIRRELDVSLRKRKFYKISQETAFDLLTNSNRKHQISMKLNDLFRDGCLNKRAPTLIANRELAAVEPLQDQNPN